MFPVMSVILFMGAGVPVQESGPTSPSVQSVQSPGPDPAPSPNIFKLVQYLTVQEPIPTHPHSDMFKLVHYEVQTVCKLTVYIQLKYLLGLSAIFKGLLN